MILTYRYGLRLTRAQHRLMEALCEAQRLLYNAALQERVEAWRRAGVSVSKHDQFRSLTQVRADDPDGYGALPVAMSRWTLARVDDAMKGFFSRVRRGERPGFPRFRAMSRWKSFGFAEFGGIRLKGGRLLSAPFGNGLKLRMHRPLPEGAELKACSFSRTGRQWHVCIAVEVAAGEAHAAPSAEVGIDLGVAHLATTSDGLHVPNARPRSARGKELRRSQRALARCRRGSKRRRKVRERLARLQRRVAAARSTHLHQVSASLSRRYAFIAAEDLKLKNMTRSARGTADEPGTNVRQKAGLNRALLDAAPARLVGLLAYKAERAGGLLVKVDPRNTSRDCSSCGQAVPKTLSERVHRCSCGAALDRDVNAARNVLQRALAAHGRARPPGDANVGHEAVRRPGTARTEAA